VVGGPWTWGRHSPIPTVDMSVEGWDYAPASFDEILARVNKGGSA
jgi:calcineurin-like phosphoesterase family protein